MSQSNTYWDAESTGIGALISKKKRLFVPLHQRDYAWTDDEVDDYVGDILDAIDRSATDYFVGLVVLVASDDGRWRILDGQQRLATTTMIYSAIRHWLRGEGKEQDAGQLESEYLVMRKLGESREPRLILNAANREVFDRCAVADLDDDALDAELKKTERGSTNFLLLRALRACRRRSLHWISIEPQTEKRVQRAYQIAHFLEESVKVVCLEVASEVDAYVLFESLNYRGNELSVLDLVKNFLFGLANPSRHEELRDAWAQMKQSVADSNADDYLKIVWTSRFGRTQRGNIFGQLKQRFVTSDDATELSAILAQDADHYAAIQSSDNPHWTRTGASTSILMGALNKGPSRFRVG